MSLLTKGQKKEKTRRFFDIKSHVQKFKKRYIALGSILFVALIVWTIIQPPKSSIYFGICKTFLETTLKYPPSLKLTSVEDFDGAVRIYYTAVEGFGNTQSKLFECTFRNDPFTGVAIDTVRVDRKDFEDKDALAKFNRTILAVIAGEPDLTVPRGYGSSLLDLKRD